MMNNEEIHKLADSVILFDYGSTASPKKAIASREIIAPASREDTRPEFDFGQEYPPGYMPQGYPPGYAHLASMQQPAPAPSAVHHHVSVKSGAPSLFSTLLVSLAASVGGSYVVQRYFVPRMPHHGG
jgi:hypothetical protein